MSPHRDLCFVIRPRALKAVVLFVGYFRVRNVRMTSVRPAYPNEYSVCPAGGTLPLYPFRRSTTANGVNDFDLERDSGGKGILGSGCRTPLQMSAIYRQRTNSNYS